MSVEVETSPTFRAAAPRRLFDAPELGGPGYPYDVSPDGTRFLMLKAGVAGGRMTVQAELRVVVNWIDELERAATKTR